MSDSILFVIYNFCIVMRYVATGVAFIALIVFRAWYGTRLDAWTAAVVAGIAGAVALMSHMIVKRLERSAD